VKPNNTSSTAWEHYAFCPKCGAQVTTSPSNPFECHSCDFTQYFNPSIGVVGILTDQEGQCLVLVRKKDPGKGKFGLPGGFADFEESAEEALFREIKEETGLEAKDFKYVCSDINPYAYKDILYHVIDLFYQCSVPSFDSIQIQKSEIADFKVCRPDISIFENMAFPSNRRALERIFA